MRLYHFVIFKEMIKERWGYSSSCLSAGIKTDLFNCLIAVDFVPCEVDSTIF